jgi:hypothetical protein
MFHKIYKNSALGIRLETRYFVFKPAPIRLSFKVEQMPPSLLYESSHSCFQMLNCRAWVSGRDEPIRKIADY